ncbi:hypothetical protein BJ322DRAFT_1217803 [Thelephora terrestris]|uniref:tRNA(Ile)-lysidine/2-thiocytidine synthase N-terminal domain-containing protein n=1 Tax=Thelephora terrestris TaxID=56493 RepID=A0A9P6HIM7_9AGAM|nr:hypothetical protein BJ322DRAFT_1217803 [Thelephora terrestris]
MAQATQDPHPDIDHWLGNHHQVADAKDGGDAIHVFAIEHGTLYGAADNTKTYEVSFHLGPLTIRIVIVIDFTKKTITVCVYAKLPFLPEFKIGCATGSFKDGITLKFNFKVISGTFTFYIKDKWLWLHYDVTILGKHWKGDIKLIPLPLLPHLPIEERLSVPDSVSNGFCSVVEPKVWLDSKPSGCDEYSRATKLSTTPVCQNGTPVSRADPSGRPAPDPTRSVTMGSSSSMWRSQLRYQPVTDSALKVALKIDKPGSGTNLNLTLKAFVCWALYEEIRTRTQCCPQDPPILAGVAKPGTTPGSTPSKTNSSYSSGYETVMTAETAIWTFDAAHGTLSPRWVNPDGYSDGSYGRSESCPEFFPLPLDHSSNPPSLPPAAIHRPPGHNGLQALSPLRKISKCFFHVFKTEVHNTITQSQLCKLGDRVAIGASGGKDSTVLAYVMKTLNERYDYGVHLYLLFIDEGITGHRDDSLESVKRNQQPYSMPFKVLSYNDLYGWTMDAVVAQIGKKKNCTFCGVFRQQALDRGAAMLNVDHIVTGHNADDIAETVLMNTGISSPSTSIPLSLRLFWFLLVMRGDM